MRRRGLAILATLAVLLGAGYADAALEEAIKRNNFGAELLKQGRLEEAIAEFQRAVELDPAYAAAHLNLAYAYERSGRVEEAIAGYRKALALDPNNLYGLNNLGVLYDRKGLYDEAIATLEKALGIDPANSAVRKNLENAKRNQAIVREGEGRIAEAQKAVTARPRDPKAAYALARVYASLDRKEPALEWLARALALGFDDLEFVRNDPVLLGLRTDPRFQQLLKRE